LASRDAVEAIEAPYLVRRGSYFYLFVSFDLCCRGTASTYRVMVGRSESVTGPYLDRDGTPMLSAGGGSNVVLGNQRWHGPGHNAVLTVGADQYLVYHAYDAEHGGAPTLRIAELLWDDAGWPIPAGP
jgi:arabinan endo-1,5-alpha-L-arabinosidase